jgi:hypothetical protein
VPECVDSGTAPGHTIGHAKLIVFSTAESRCKRGFWHTRLDVLRIEFSELPKTISGKIRRVQLRGIEFATTIRTSAYSFEKAIAAKGTR